MTELPSGFDFRGVHFYQDQNNSQTFYYVPGEPAPERSPAGKPTLNFLLSDQFAMLQLGTRWEADTNLLEAARQEIQNRFPDLDAKLVRFTSAPVSVEGVALILLADDGKEEEKQVVTSSGFPPYAALFNVTLTAEEKARVASALNGRTGLLKVVYKLTLASEQIARTIITGDVRIDVAELEANASAADSLARIEAALGDGRLRLERAASSAAPDELKEKADRMAKEKAADILLSMARKETSEQLDAADLKASASLTTTVSLPLTRSTDVGTWFTGGADKANILITPNTSPNAPAESHPASAIIRVGFDLKDIPVAFIQIKWDEAEATIRPPVFQPVNVSGQTDKPLVVKTSYTDGGAPYEVNLAAPPENKLELMPEDMGLVLITVDANARRAAGAKQAHIQVNYKPSGQGTPDERSIRLRFGDWTESWYVVTRSHDLGGALEIKWTETNADGSVIEHPTVTTSETEIKL
jgi:hypothetical protein